MIGHPWAGWGSSTLAGGRRDAVGGVQSIPRKVDVEDVLGGVNVHGEELALEVVFGWMVRVMVLRKGSTRLLLLLLCLGLLLLFHTDTAWAHHAFVPGTFLLPLRTSSSRASLAQVISSRRP